MLKALTIKDNLKFLRQISKEVDFDNDKELEQNIKDIKEFCLGNSVFAMACVQLGIPKRLVYIKSTDPNAKANPEDKQFMMINPKILSKRGRTEYWEACQSCLDYTCLVERPYEMTVEYQNEKGKTIRQTFEGFPATVISHELDHLDGILHMDRAKELYWMSRDERVEFRKTHGYEILSKTCDFEYPNLEKG